MCLSERRGVTLTSRSRSGRVEEFSLVPLGEARLGHINLEE